MPFNQQSQPSSEIKSFNLVRLL